MPWIARCPLSAFITVGRACPGDQSLAPHPNHSHSFTHPVLTPTLIVVCLFQTPRALPLPGSPACTPPHSLFIPSRTSSLRTVNQQQVLRGHWDQSLCMKPSRAALGWEVLGHTSSPLGIPWALTRSPYGLTHRRGTASSILNGKERIGWRVWLGLSQGDSGWDMGIMPGQEFKWCQVMRTSGDED